LEAVSETSGYSESCV